MRETNLSRTRMAAPSDECYGTCTMVWRAKGTLCNEMIRFAQFTSNRIDTCNFYAFFACKRRQNGGESFRKKRFATAGGTTKEGVMSACCGNLQCAFRVFLSFDMRHIIAKRCGYFRHSFAGRFVGRNRLLSQEVFCKREKRINRQ